MLKEIKYNGYTTQPSDYQSTDGDLARAYNVIPENGALTPIMPPAQIATFTGALQVFIHNNNFTHYIIAKNSDGKITLSYADKADLDNISEPFLAFDSSNETLRSISAIGNTLTVASSEKMYYVLWRDNSYNFLGNNLPDVEIQFALDGEIVSHSYTDALATKKGTATTGEGWTSVAQVAFSRAYGVPEYIDVDSVVGTEVTLDANTDYRFTCLYKGDYFYITGLNTTTSQRENVAWICSNKHRTVRTSAPYKQLRFEFGYAGGGPNFLTIEKGQSFSVNLNYVVDNTADNFNALLAMVNSFRENYATKRNRFIHPFFVRYAVKLYDGSYARISTPVLMVPNSGYVPLLNYAQAAESGIYVSAYAFIADLQLKVVSATSELWQDIIDSVDIFVSQPVYPYNQGQEFQPALPSLIDYKVLAYDDSGNTVADQLSNIDYGFMHLNYNGSQVDDGYSRRSLYQYLNAYYSIGAKTSRQWPVVQPAPRTDDEITKDITETSAFHLIHSIKFSQLANFSAAFSDLPLEEGALLNLASKKTLDDDIMASRSIATASLYTYNNRLHAYNASVVLPKPTWIELQNNHVGSRSNPYSSHVYVFIHSPQGEKVAHVSGSADYFSSSANLWFFYPDNNAYKALFLQGSFTTSVPLTRHPFLNGAFWFAGSLGAGGLQYMSSNEQNLKPPTAFSSSLSYPSSIYVSEVANPFVFSSAALVDVGGNNVLALATAAKPLSTGQFGQFPLYAFTDAGVWALETAASGSYAARQPITRDVCANPQSLCQLESSVLFATTRGVMRLSGSSAECITEFIDSEFPFSLFDLSNDRQGKAQNQLLNAFNKLEPNILLTAPNASIAPFSIFVRECRIFYDYAHQRIFLVNTAMPYAYVFSIRDKAWGMMQADVKLIINSYPDAQAIDSSGNLIDFSRSDDSETAVFILSRPFAMGLPDTHKTVQTVIQRGFFASKLMQVLYASNDLFHWHTVASSNSSCLRYNAGSPYKFFRIAVIGNMAESESIYGLTVQFQTKLDNQPR